jgi:hypothetical protein
MVEPLSGSRQKIERANKHIADLEARILALPDSYIATIVRTPRLGTKLLNMISETATPRSVSRW